MMPWHNHLKYYYVKIPLIQQAIPLLYKNQADRLPAAEGPKPMRAPGAARRTPHQPSKTLNFVLLYCVFLFCYLCYRYLPLRRPISREDAHRVYPRYPRVFLYVIIYCPLPHQSLWERLGYHCRVLVWLLALYAKLNWFFANEDYGRGQIHPRYGN